MKKGVLIVLVGLILLLSISFVSAYSVNDISVSGCDNSYLACQSGENAVNGCTCPCDFSNPPSWCTSGCYQDPSPWAQMFPWFFPPTCDCDATQLACEISSPYGTLKTILSPSSTGCVNVKTYSGTGLARQIDVTIPDCSSSIPVIIPATRDNYCCPVCEDKDKDGYSVNIVSGADCGEIDCDDSDSDINPGAIEYCNNIDDDCDGVVDNPYNITLGKNCSVGLGECKAEGIIICNPDKDWATKCSVEPGNPSKEVCDDGKDNDCDRWIDSEDGDCCSAYSIHVNIIDPTEQVVVREGDDAGNYIVGTEDENIQCRIQLPSVLVKNDTSVTLEFAGQSETLSADPKLGEIQCDAFGKCFGRVVFTGSWSKGTKYHCELTNIQGEGACTLSTEKPKSEKVVISTYNYYVFGAGKNVEYQYKDYLEKSDLNKNLDSVAKKIPLRLIGLDLTPVCCSGFWSYFFAPKSYCPPSSVVEDIDIPTTCAKNKRAFDRYRSLADSQAEKAVKNSGALSGKSTVVLFLPSNIIRLICHNNGAGCFFKRVIGGGGSHFIYISSDISYGTTLAHELGHRHADLCDEYDKKSWDFQNFFYHCPNRFPDCCDKISYLCGTPGDCDGMPYDNETGTPDRDRIYPIPKDYHSIMGDSYSPGAIYPGMVTCPLRKC